MTILKDVINTALKNGNRKELNNGHVVIKKDKDGKIYCCYVSMPGYAVPQARDRFFEVTEDMLGLGEYDLPPENRFVMQPAILAELGLE